MADMIKIIDGVPMVSTLDMWKDLNVEHSAIIQMAKKYEKEFQEIRTFLFLKSKSTGGRPAEFCYLDEEQATFLITLMKNSPVVVTFKHRLTREFFRMRNILSDLASQRQNAQWLETRAAGKPVRRIETDTVKKFVAYAVAQGSSNAEKYYANISTMQNKALFFIEQKYNNLRDCLNVHQLGIIGCADTIVAKALEDGMSQGLHYKDIYKLAKARIEMFAEVHGKTLVPSLTVMIRLSTQTAFDSCPNLL